jgi:hypothetical protein
MIVENIKRVFGEYLQVSWFSKCLERSYKDFNLQLYIKFWGHCIFYGIAYRVLCDTGEIRGKLEVVQVQLSIV